ncbi:hypothetical protein SAMD00019534_077880 [Acytostelium subglobosum LB1]|uniref:hypothetical protein n=1 Tax=Acytostelium subglobosum LB1 TaxID=1410327 RepID=UPI0006448539|nr:hypothetical protein SAMD00019534_077880 [Acytostelium subglobosum LB1]GAM24613.1 hypothetical protein SAMD00019534_077880 [Acytostelium subglobosum LB1]|eukprot:XP_012752282.1 hypothetical protein SAMD00019534_077880 [Acytostelium subglobosum LB1]
MTVVDLTFYTVLMSSVLFAINEKPWLSIQHMKASQWKNLALFAVLNTGSLLLWNTGLKYIGPLGALLLTDYTFETYPIILNNLMQGNLFGNDVARATLMLVGGYLSIPLFGGVTGTGTPYSTLFFGGVCLVVYNLLGSSGIIHKWQHSHGSGSGTAGVQNSKNKLHSLGMLASSLLLLVLKVYEYSTTPYSAMPPADTTSHELFHLLQLFFVALFGTFLNHHIDSIIEQQLGFLVYSKATLTSYLITSAVLSLFLGFSTCLPPLLIISFMLILTAIHILFSKSNQFDGGANQGLMGLGAGAMATKSTSSLSFIMKDVVRQIVEKPTSRRIFIFLVVNLMFMFVEMAYGIWTNSLGLITDACHMLFDATALFIALVAEVISQWKPNETYTYGYGRVQILSGFVNGIFLIFIAITILMESIERHVLSLAPNLTPTPTLTLTLTLPSLKQSIRLMEPPEINTDKLLLVSVLGFIVNMVGVFSFHGDHGHSHGGGGGHSHAHGGHHEEPADLLAQGQQQQQPKKRSVNIDGVFLHLLADTLGSVGVIISSLIIQIWGYTLADPICSLCISILIFLSVIPLITNTAKTLLQCTPEALTKDVSQIIGNITNIEGVTRYSDFHFWTHSEEMTVSTIRVFVEPNANEKKIRKAIGNIMKDNQITASTVEIVKGTSSQQHSFQHSIPHASS